MTGRFKRCTWLENATRDNSTFGKGKVKKDKNIFFFKKAHIPIKHFMCFEKVCHTSREMSDIFSCVSLKERHDDITHWSISSCSFRMNDDLMYYC
jgi:hypothetical protein